MSDELERDIDRLRKATARLEKPAPRAAVDEAIRLAARRPRRRLAPIATVAAGLALAALLVPQLLEHPSFTESEQAARKAPPVQTVAAPAPPRARALAGEERAARARAEDRLQHELRALANAERETWQRRLLELHEREPALADALLEAYRERFDEPDGFGWKELEQPPP